MLLAKSGMFFFYVSGLPKGFPKSGKSGCFSLSIVTRNIADFEPMGVATLNPWIEN
jgi:hypothetical protein